MAREKQENKSFSSRGLELTDRIITINRVSKVVKGGKRFRFSVLVAVGDSVSQIGLGTGKAKEISEAMRKAIEHAKKNLVDIKMVGQTIPHPIIGKFGAAQVLLRPAAPGSGVLAGGAVRPIMVKPGVDTLTLDQAAEALARKEGAEPTFKNYKASWAPIPFPGTLCVSINEEVVHGIPSKDRFLEEGDIISIDTGATIEGFCGDAACTVAVGKISDARQRLLDVTLESLHRGMIATRS